MRHSSATAAPVTRDPYPEFVRKVIHGIVSEGFTLVRVEPEPEDDAHVIFYTFPGSPHTFHRTVWA